LLFSPIYRRKVNKRASRELTDIATSDVLACKLLEEGRGRESPGKTQAGYPAVAAEGERPMGRGAESLRQKDRVPEGVLESSTGPGRSAPTG
jgi:hypothetical protein